MGANAVPFRRSQYPSMEQSVPHYLQQEFLKLEQALVAIQGGVSSSTPIGTVVDFAGLVEPSQWVFCYGQELDKNTYSTLYAVIQDTYGPASAGKFRVPDLRGRVTVGRDNMGGTLASRITNAFSGIIGTVLGAFGGDERMQQHNHTATSTSVSTSTSTSTPTHNGGGANKSVIGRTTNTGVYNITSGGAVDGFAQVTPSVTTTTTTGTTTNTTINNTGLGGSQNVQPSIILNKIIYAGV